jgi:hypothetical protein
LDVDIEGDLDRDTETDRLLLSEELGETDGLPETEELGLLLGLAEDVSMYSSRRA